MTKKLASKRTKRLLSEAEIKELNLPKADFTTSWQGRLYISDAGHSMIAEKVGITEKGEYAIKVR
ncbi:DNA-directed RNA polymerase subunit E'' [Candidatus Woesearchaeota archaeon]|nr:DNA-directed RNA polymerase subunit E'' [Candidatus Woesearchaeota archaeon]